MATVKSVLVTGAQGALGQVVVRRFLGAGCEVSGTDVEIRDPNLMKGEFGGRVRWIAADLADPGAVSKLIPADFDAWVHCAGGFRWARIEDLTDGDLDFLLKANFKSSFHLARHLVPSMKKRGFGRIVLVSARATLQGAAGMSAYSASKAAINLLTECLAEEVKGQDITVNAVLPSIIDTPANRKDMPKADPSAWVSPAQLAEILFSLTQPWGTPVNGALIPVSGRV